MAGGGTVNGDAILSRYEARLEKAVESMKKEAWQPRFKRG
jgi:hypothetical protein